MVRALSIAFGLLIVHACSIEPRRIQKRSIYVVEDVDSQDSDEPDSEDALPDAVKDAAGDESIGSSSDDDDSKDQQPLPDVDPVFQGRAFFQANVLPDFYANCSTCHAEPRVMVPTRGPLSIYSYDAMFALISDTDPSGQNNLMRKMMNVEPHGGGNRCTDGAFSGSCKTVADWFEGEFQSSGSDVGFGQISGVSDTGRVYGWAVNPDDTGEIVRISFYIGDPDVEGVLILEVDADGSGYDGGATGNHSFSIQLPDEYVDGREHALFVVASIGITRRPLGNSPLRYTAYRPKQDGMTYFNNTLEPLLVDRCGGCHTVAYSVQWSSLLLPSPAVGGAATSNELINKPSGQVPHEGGNVCGGIDGTPCAQIQEWWRIEFQ